MMLINQNYLYYGNRDAVTKTVNGKDSCTDTVYHNYPGL
jgi:hypothetical protein